MNNDGVKVFNLGQVGSVGSSEASRFGAVEFDKLVVALPDIELLDTISLVPKQNVFPSL